MKSLHFFAKWTLVISITSLFLMVFGGGLLVLPFTGGLDKCNAPQWFIIGLFAPLLGVLFSGLLYLIIHKAAVVKVIKEAINSL